MLKKKFSHAEPCLFTENHYESIDFCETDMEKKDLCETVFQSCVFYKDTRQTGGSFQRSKLRNTVFIDCDLTMCRFGFADLFGAEFIRCRLIGSDFENASFAEQLSGTHYFCSGKIEDSNLSNACLAGLLLQNCSLKGNRWFETDIMKADFSGADLSGGEFSGISWTTANFQGCDLRGSSLPGMDIRKMDLTGIRFDTWQISQLFSALGAIIT